MENPGLHPASSSQTAAPLFRRDARSLYRQVFWLPSLRSAFPSASTDSGLTLSRNQRLPLDYARGEGYSGGTAAFALHGASLFIPYYREPVQGDAMTCGPRGQAKTTARVVTRSTTCLSPAPRRSRAPCRPGRRKRTRRRAGRDGRPSPWRSAPGRTTILRGSPG